MAAMTTATNPANLARYYERKLLSVLEPNLVLAKFGKETKIPKGEGKLVRWTRYAKHNPSLTPLTECTNPAEVSIPSSQVEAIVDQYGEYAKVSDLLSFTALDPVLSSLSERFGRAAADLIEQLIVAELDAEGFEQLVANAANVDAITQTDVLEHQEIIEAMVRQQQDFIQPHESGKYVACLNTAAKFDIMSDTQAGSWSDINKFVAGAQDKIIRGQFGEMYGARLTSSDRMSSAANAGSVQVRNNYVIGEEAFGTVSLASRSVVEMIMKDERSGGISNPLNMCATVGYKLKGYKVKYLDSGSKRVTIIKAASAQDA